MIDWLSILHAKSDDPRPVIEFHVVECKAEGCKFVTPSAEGTRERHLISDMETAHGRTSGHRDYWHYTIQRGTSQLFF